MRRYLQAMRRYVETERGNRILWFVGTPVFVVAMILALLLAGCHGGLWFDPDDPAQVDLVAGDLRATFAIAADAMLTSEEATPAEAEQIARIFDDTAAAMRDRDPQAGERAMQAILEELVDEPDLLGMYRRLITRVMDRVDAHLQAMDLAAADETARQVAETLTVAALEGVAEGARDYARAPPDEG